MNRPGSGFTSGGAAKPTWLRYLPYLALVAWATGCATIPAEVVELSYVEGRDLAAVHSAYRDLIHQHFDDLRNRRLDYVEQTWAPKFIADWITKGRLVDMANGKIMWSPEKKGFAPVPAGHEQELLLASVNFWSKAALKQIEKKKQGLLDPLNQDEASLLTAVDDAFKQLYMANATITAHLNSLRKVQKVQDDALKALSIGDLREKINGALAKASTEAEAALEALRKAENTLPDPAPTP